jgi:hypothetical protein
MLQEHTPYMLRNDGELYTCGETHPYVVYCYTEDSKVIDTFISNSDQVKWFYDHTRYEEVKRNVAIIVESLYRLGFIVEIDLTSDRYCLDEGLLIEYIKTLSQACNQEFCRMRTSNLLWGGNGGNTYFRISSHDFNWFDAIWNVAYDNRNFITSVTISTDSTSLGGEISYYVHNGKLINLLPTDEFITLSGNPIIEELHTDTLDMLNHVNKQLSKAKCLYEAFGELNPKYINGFNKLAIKKYKARYFL